MNNPVENKQEGNLHIPAHEWLKKLFECENCSECGKDEKFHVAVPIMGNWFARCVPCACGMNTRDSNGHCIHCERDLDSEVHDLKSEEASAINNEGVDAQLKYLGEELP